jgi:hypothetical protein
MPFWMTGVLCPVRAIFHPVLGPPSTPIECYLRLMFGAPRTRQTAMPENAAAEPTATAQAATAQQ